MHHVSGSQRMAEGGIPPSPHHHRPREPPPRPRPCSRWGGWRAPAIRHSFPAPVPAAAGKKEAALVFGSASPCFRLTAGPLSFLFLSAGEAFLFRLPCHPQLAALEPRRVTPLSGTHPAFHEVPHTQLFMKLVILFPLPCHPQLAALEPRTGWQTPPRAESALARPKALVTGGAWQAERRRQTPPRAGSTLATVGPVTLGPAAAAGAPGRHTRRGRRGEPAARCASGGQGRGGGRCGPCAANGCIFWFLSVRLYILVVCGAHKFRLREPLGGLGWQTAGRGEVQQRSGPQSTPRVRCEGSVRWTHRAEAHERRPSLACTVVPSVPGPEFPPQAGSALVRAAPAPALPSAGNKETLATGIAPVAIIRGSIRARTRVSPPSVLMGNTPGRFGGNTPSQGVGVTRRRGACRQNSRGRCAGAGPRRRFAPSALVRAAR